MSTKEMLIQYLNEDLAAEYGTIIRYTYQSGNAFGLMGSELREWFAKEIVDELGHAAFLNDMIIHLGGEPVTTPQPFEKPESLRDMLALNETMELQGVKNYIVHSELADKLGYVELKIKLEEMAADEAGHARELHRILKGM